MTGQTISSYSGWVNRTAIDSSGDKIGTISDVYVDNDTSEPSWLTVRTGLFGTKVSFVPIAGASAAGDDVMVGWDKSVVKDAPRADADGALSSDEEDALYAHYGLTTSTSTTADSLPAPTPPDRRAVGNGHDTSGPDTDDAMTRSEEELRVGTQRRETGTARLRKWVETENVTVTVPVEREKARLVTEPITDANRDAALAGGDLTEEEHEVVLSEEVVDVQKRVVPKERVRLETETETENVPVSEEVRKEHIEFEGGDDTRR